MKMTNNKQPESNLLLTACKRYYLAAGATQGNIAYTQTVKGKLSIQLPKVKQLKTNKT
jgi:hypothetical protein